MNNKVSLLKMMDAMKLKEEIKGYYEFNNDKELDAVLAKAEDEKLIEVYKDGSGMQIGDNILGFMLDLVFQNEKSITSEQMTIVCEALVEIVLKRE